jgi:hypothetical protein
MHPIKNIDFLPEIYSAWSRSIHDTAFHSSGVGFNYGTGVIEAFNAAIDSVQTKCIDRKCHSVQITCIAECQQEIEQRNCRGASADPHIEYVERALELSRAEKIQKDYLHFRNVDAEVTCEVEVQETVILVVFRRKLLAIFFEFGPTLCEMLDLMLIALDNRPGRFCPLSVIRPFAEKHLELS